ncbi:MAG: EamA family transporter [Alphaproteobacteria bacterium]|nr:EamA family transporter [Alphaproteobacteria bacterium]MDP7044194.1 EamA family transporter [Alphaproteobacteria bacterium]
MKPVHILLMILAMAFWGLNFVVIKTGLLELPPLLMLALRFALAAALLVPFVRPPTGKVREIICISVILGFFHFGLLFWGLTRVEAALGAVVIQLQLPFAVIFAMLLLNERPSARSLSGTAIAFAGVILIGSRAEFQGYVLYLLLIVFAGAAWAFSNIPIKRLGSINVFTLNGWISLFAAPQLLALSMILESGQWSALAAAGWRGYGAVAYMAVVSTIAVYGMWYYLLGKYPMSQVVPYTLVAPLVGVLSGTMLLGEELTDMMALGAAATLAGVAIIVFASARDEAVEPVAAKAEQGEKP